MAKELGIKFFETSARTGKNVDEAFQSVITDMVVQAGGKGGSKLIPNYGATKIFDDAPSEEPAFRSSNKCC